MTRVFTAIYERDGDWWVAHAEELPGALTQGATIDEAREKLKDAIRLLLESYRETADAAPYREEIAVAV